MAAADAHKRSFIDFVETMGYTNAIHNLVSAEHSRLMLSLDDLRSFDSEITNNFIRRPAEYIPAFEEALREMVSNFDPSYAKQGTANKFKIGVTGSFGSHHVSPRGLSSTFLNNIVYVEGIVTKCTLVRPKVMKSAHWCPTTKKFTFKEYRDHTSLAGAMTGSAYPQKDSEGHNLETEFGMCEYMDHQIITIQEMPEKAPPGQLPRSVEVLLEADLVDTAKPGDRLQVAGIHRALPSKANQSGMFRTIVIGNNVVQLTKYTGSTDFTAEDLSNMKRIAKRDDCVDLLAHSLAPSIFGHEHEKMALLLMLLGGAERNLANGTHLRGDINILMLGDPGTAKSQLLRAVMRTAPLAISTTGRGSSGVGLTAAVTVDTETGARRLEAGAMVLADRGVCCVDEFDKMLDADRVAIHEVMEQQTVTISKAGIHASLNARCAVVAAANPVFGSYDPSAPPMQNIAMPDSLLSRFDLLFIILDKKDAESDRRISSHVLRQHCSRHAPPPADLPGVATAAGNKGESAKTTEVYARVDARTVAPGDEMREQVTADFMKKYIQYAKKKVDQPILGEDATKYICEAYANLREKMAGQRGRTLPITARTLETMIRLSAAHAKCHLRGLVTLQDAEAAVALLNYAILKDGTNDKTKGGETGKGGGDDDDDDDDDDGAGNEYDDPEDENYVGKAGKRSRENAETRPARAKKQATEASKEANEDGANDQGAGDSAEGSVGKSADKSRQQRQAKGKAQSPSSSQPKARERSSGASPSVATPRTDADAGAAPAAAAADADADADADAASAAEEVVLSNSEIHSAIACLKAVFAELIEKVGGNVEDVPLMAEEELLGMARTKRRMSMQLLKAALGKLDEENAVMFSSGEIRLI